MRPHNRPKEVLNFQAELEDQLLNVHDDFSDYYDLMYDVFGPWPDEVYYPFYDEPRSVSSTRGDDIDLFGYEDLEIMHDVMDDHRFYDPRHL